MIGIIGAMDEEVAELLEKTNVSRKVTKASMEFHIGTLSGKDVVIVRSGIGKVNAAVCTQILVDDFSIDAVINTGIAGSLNANIDIADIVLSKDVLHHDMDATGFGYEPGQIPRMPVKEFLGDAHLIECGAKAIKELFPETGCHIGRVVSGDQFISDSAKKDYIVSTFSGDCTEMEGAAIAQAAYLNNIPFLIIRAISDKADNSATMDYPAFEKLAIAKLVGTVEKIIELV